jgi:phenylalanine-4-hydroxylase
MLSRIKYTQKDHLTWHNLYVKQLKCLKAIGYPDFFEFLKEIGLSSNNIPQLEDISKILYHKTGWSLIPVPGIIPANDFYSLLANKKFPSTTFIRSENEGFNSAPDIFHELFGHVAMLVDERYAYFMERIACFALTCNKLERKIIQRLLWYTIEVGLVLVDGQIKIYGGALLSSNDESIYSVKSTIPKREPFKIDNISRTPFRIDLFNEYYYYIENFDQLKDFTLSREILQDCLNSAVMMSERPVSFDTKISDDYSSTSLFST